MPSTIPDHLLQFFKIFDTPIDLLANTLSDNTTRIVIRTALGQLDTSATSTINLCAEVALSVLHLRKWWMQNSSNQSLDPRDASNEQISCSKLQDLLDILDRISLGSPAVSWPSDVLTVLFIFVSAAAMNMGCTINFSLEKPIEPYRTLLFQKAYDICEHLPQGRQSRRRVESAISYAHYVDQRALTGPSDWLPVEKFMTDNVEYVCQHIGTLEIASSFFDFFCQSMWESGHEYALFLFCEVLQRLDARISAKWSSTLQQRWAALNKTVESFTAFSDSEIQVISSFIEIRI
jgi:hypothetical protein